MDTIVINVRKEDNAKVILELAEKLGEEGKILNRDDQEDFLMGNIIETEKTDENVSRENIFKILRS